MSDLSYNSKNYNTHIIAIPGSPMKEDEKELIKITKELKKWKVPLDIALFDDEDANAEVLKKLIDKIFIEINS